MAGIGALLAALAVVYLYVRVRHKRLPESRWFYRALVAAGPLSLVALICGWIATEVGRQPWVVYGVMRTRDAVTGASGIPVGYATIAVVYLGLAATVAVILVRNARAPLEPLGPRPARGAR
jgi:cytochrome d ubiquinol oxidase subunit I